MQEIEENIIIPLESIKKRGRPSKKQTQVDPNLDANAEKQEEDSEEWIKTEYVLCNPDQNNFTDTKTERFSDDNGINTTDLDFKTDGKKFTCSLCNITFISHRELWRHKKVCITTLNCDFCSEIYTKSEELRQHITEKHPEKLTYFEETKRHRKRRRIDPEVVNKAKVVVNDRTYYHCNQCGKNLHSPYTYIKHNRIHTGEKPHVCDLCGKQFRVAQGLVRHLKETHAGIKNNPCDLCGRMFSSKRNVEEHRRIHTNERPYICDLCGKAFKQKASLFVHSRSHSDTFPYRCTYCNQGFRAKPPLLVHITRHTGEKPYSCDICGRSFRIKYEVKRHRLIHSDAKPFSCEECGLSFRQKRYLRNHNRINHNNRPTD